jgi:histidinol-phosphatase (PHP family)
MSEPNRRDLHMHTHFSDGTTSPEEMVLAALAKGFQTIAITDHMPLPFVDHAGMKIEALESYRAEVQALQQKFAEQIEIKLALEFDYLPDYREWTKQILDLGWDFKPASVHFTQIELDGKPWVIDGAAEFDRALSEIFKDDIRAFCTHYYRLVREMVLTGWFDQVNHFDLIKKFNADRRYFDDRADWYKMLVEEILQVVAKSGMSLEINTAGLDKPVNEQYPADWIISRCRELHIPLTINSDAHRPEEIGRHFDFIQETYFS